MPADGNILTFPPRPRAPFAALVNARPALVPTEPGERVDITGGADGCTVWLDGRPFATGKTLSNAARIAGLLRERLEIDAKLAALGAAPFTPDAA